MGKKKAHFPTFNSAKLTKKAWNCCATSSFSAFFNTFPPLSEHAKDFYTFFIFLAQGNEMWPQTTDTVWVNKVERENKMGRFVEQNELLCWTKWPILFRQTICVTTEGAMGDCRDEKSRPLLAAVLLQLMGCGAPVCLHRSTSQERSTVCFSSEGLA